MDIADAELPHFLHDYVSLSEHLDTQLIGKSTTDKGTLFANFVMQIVPLSDFGLQFRNLHLAEKKSHDGGVDIVSDGKDCCIQSKLRINDINDFDEIISGFQNYYELNHKNPKPRQTTIFEMLGTDNQIKDPSQEVSFMIATLSEIKKRIIPLYEKSKKSSRPFYEQLKSSGQIAILDGPEILPILQGAFRKLYILQSKIELEFSTQFIQKDGVFVGIVGGDVLRDLYKKFGEALFFENIRSFLGETSGKKKISNKRENVNGAIRETASNNPHLMLALNNGITFRAKHVGVIDSKTLYLDYASIVNGCQTTMSIVESPKPEAVSILVKVVEIEDSWAIAKSANFQNRVDQAELELAQYVRPQRVKKAASKLGISVRTAYSSIFDVLASIQRDHVDHEEIYSLFFGFFSKTPNNVLQTNYTELRHDLLEDLQSQDPAHEEILDEILEALFRLNQLSEKGKQRVLEIHDNEQVKQIFQRFWRPDRANYRAIVAILAACGCVGRNIYAPTPVDSKGIRQFFSDLMTILENDPNKFVRFYEYAFTSIALKALNPGKTGDEIIHYLYDEIKQSNFNLLLTSLSLLANSSESRLKNPQ